MPISSQISELYLYVVLGCFTAFCTRVHKLLFDKVHFDFSSDYSIDPQTIDTTQPDGPHVVPYGEGDLDSEEPHHQWYCPAIENTTDQSRDSNPNPITQVNWSDDTKPPACSGSKPPSTSRGFQLGMELTYCDLMENSVAVVY